MEHEHSDRSKLPSWIWGPFRVYEQRLKDEDRYLHLTLRGLRQLQVLPQVIEVLGRVAPSEAEPTRRTLPVEDAKRDADWVKKEAENGFPLLHAHSVVGIWSAVEVLAEDFAVTWLGNVEQAWGAPELAKLRMPLARFQQLRDAERPAFVISELIRTFSPDARRGAGQLRALLGVFNLWPTIGPHLQRALHELCHVRNVLVHCAGKADQKLAEECPWLEAVPGQQLEVSHTLYGWYMKAARRFGERVLSQAMVALGFRGCECPGLDEIRDRPDNVKPEARRPTSG